MFIRIALGVVAALLVCAGTAQASSLVYIKDYNVWTANPDGTAARAITTDGFRELPYGSPSQSDDGTILAARGEKFVKLDRQGNRIGDPLPSILVGRPPYALAVGPFDPQISPDGHKLAYWIGTWSTWFDYGSSINWTEPHDAVIWQDADTGAQLGFTLNYQKPSWFQDSRHALLNQPMNRFAAQIVAGALGANEHDSTPILKDSDSKPAGEYYAQDLADPELTKAGDKLVTLRGPDQETIRFYDMRSGSPVISECGLGQPVGGSAADPTWAPDGSALAWAEGDGIWMTPVGALDSADCSWAQPRLVIPGALQPDWGPADGTAAGPKAQPAPGSPAAGSAGPGARRRALVVAAPRSIKRAALLRRGVGVKLTAAQAGKATATLRLGRRVVARKTRRLAAARTAVLVLRPARAEAARVRRARALQIRVQAGSRVHSQRLRLRR